ncbi:MAG: histidine--tRNA ligase [Chitinispirillaceae bacterium]|nr:histidine--tRNA ligase [Chitinispirillaceae bacterium]
MAVPGGPKGTRDFYPEQLSLQNHIFSSWERTCQRYGFEPCEGPMFEHLELYKQKSGDEIENQLYVFTDKAGRELALRPEITPTVGRMVAAAGSHLKYPIRWYSIPRLFRYEKMQKGRLREFFQLNMDIIGIAGVSADAELIAAAIDTMRDLGLSHEDFKVRISSRTLLEELLCVAGLDTAQRSAFYRLLDKKSKLPGEVYSAELTNAIPDTTVRSRIARLFEATSLEDIIDSPSDLPSLAALRELFVLLGEYGFADYVLFDISIVRGLAYYTGMVFELFDTHKEMRAIAGGGRYDRLVELYGGPSTPAVGFAAGDVVLADLLMEKGLLPHAPPRSSCYIVSLGDIGRHEIITLARDLRDNGVSCEFALKQSNVGKQMKAANSARAPYVLFAGGDEGRAGMVKIKNMKSGEEFLISRSEIAAAMAPLVNVGQKRL